MHEAVQIALPLAILNTAFIFACLSAANLITDAEAVLAIDDDTGFLVSFSGLTLLSLCAFAYLRLTSLSCFLLIRGLKNFWPLIVNDLGTSFAVFCAMAVILDFAIDYLYLPPKLESNAKSSRMKNRMAVAKAIPLLPDFSRRLGPCSSIPAIALIYAYLIYRIGTPRIYYALAFSGILLLHLMLFNFFRKRRAAVLLDRLDSIARTNA